MKLPKRIIGLPLMSYVTVTAKPPVPRGVVVMVGAAPLPSNVP
jgi:hypothetical protein